MKKHSLISVIIPSYQASSTILRAIGSVQSQTHVAEILIMDDGSTDNTALLVGSVPDPRVIFEGSENRGACHARNRGLQRATSEYVLFLDADDDLEPNYFDQFSDALQNENDIIIAGHRHIDFNGGEIGKVTFDRSLSGSDILAEYLHNPIQTGGFVWRRRWLVEGGGWDESFPIFQDAEISIRMLLRDAKIEILPNPQHLAVWREHDSETRITNNLSRHKVAAMFRGLSVHREDVVKTGNTRATEGLAARFYELARKCYLKGFYDIGDDCLITARELGLTGHIGSTGHRIMSNIVGLKRKLIFVDYIRSLKQR